jgi:hypothetical protein
MKDFVRLSLLQEQDRIHSYHRHRLPVACPAHELDREQPGTTVVVIDKTAGCSAYVGTRAKISAYPETRTGRVQPTIRQGLSVRRSAFTDTSHLPHLPLLKKLEISATSALRRTKRCHV